MTQTLNGEKMRDLLQYLNEENTFYKKIITNHNIDLQGTIELNDLPIITKKIIKDHYEEFVSPEKDKNPYVFELTTGSTGIPLKCPKTKQERVTASLELWKRRRKIDPKVNPDNFFSIFGAESIQRVGNMCDLEPNNMNYCLNNLDKVKPRWISASPTVVYEYARMIKKGRIDCSKIADSLKYIELIGEYISFEHRLYIEQAFKCKTILQYGLRETWCIAYECSCGKMHVIEELIYVEVDTSKKESIGIDNAGEILITSYYNRSMPILRYRTGDIGEIRYQECSCGTYGLTLKLYGGRTSGIIEGKPRMLGDMFFKRVLYSLIENGRDTIANIWIEQTEVNHFKLLIIKKENYTEESTRMLKELITQNLQRNVDIQIEFVDKIPLLSNGKQPSLFSVKLKLMY